MSESTLRFLQHENARLQDENKLLKEENLSLHRYLGAVKELYVAAQRLESVEHPFDLLDELLYKTIQVIGANDGSISRLDPITGELVFVLVHGDIQQELRGYRIKGDVGIAGWVVNQREPLIVNNPRQDWRFSLKVDEEFEFFTRSIMCAPLLIQDELIGVIQLLNKRGDEFTETDMILLSLLSQVAAKVLAAVPA